VHILREEKPFLDHNLSKPFEQLWLEKKSGKKTERQYRNFNDRVEKGTASQ
jgi:hypothetical protein